MRSLFMYLISSLFPLFSRCTSSYPASMIFSSLSHVIAMWVLGVGALVPMCVKLVWSLSKFQQFQHAVVQVLCGSPQVLIRMQFIISFCANQ